MQARRGATIILDEMETQLFVDPVQEAEKYIEASTTLDDVADSSRLDRDGRDTESFLFSAAATLFYLPNSEAERANFERNNEVEWYRRMRRPGVFFKRLRMTESSFDVLYNQVKPFMRYPDNGRVGHPPEIHLRIRLLLVLYRLAQGGCLLLTRDTVDVSESTFNRVPREVLSAIECALPTPMFPSSVDGQSKVAVDFVNLLGCLFRKVTGVIDGSLIPIRIPPARIRCRTTVVSVCIRYPSLPLLTVGSASCGLTQVYLTPSVTVEPSRRVALIANISLALPCFTRDYLISLTEDSL